MEYEILKNLWEEFIVTHHQNKYPFHVYKDEYMEKIITPKEYQEIATLIQDGVKTMNIKGDEDTKFERIVTTETSGIVLAKNIFTSRSLKNAVQIGCTQYVSIYDKFNTISLNQTIKCYEIDTKEIIKEKQSRIKKLNIIKPNITYIAEDNLTLNELLKTTYNKKETSFISLMGLDINTSKEEFSNIIELISKIVPSNSTIIFMHKSYKNKREESIANFLSTIPDEPVTKEYTYHEIEKLLSKNNFRIYEYLTPKDIEKYFYDFNTLSPNRKIKFPNYISFCLAVKK